MLALRILVGAALVALVITLLGYALSRDRRWLTYAAVALKMGIAIALLLFLLRLLTRFLV